VRAKLSKFAVVLLVAFSAFAILGVSGAHAAVASETASNLVASVTGIFSGGVNDFMAMFVAVVPKLFLIFIAIVMLRFGIKLFRKFTRGA
jgi:uncharacterized membrane protein YeiH